MKLKAWGKEHGEGKTENGNGRVRKWENETEMGRHGRLRDGKTKGLGEGRTENGDRRKVKQ